MSSLFLDNLHAHQAVIEGLLPLAPDVERTAALMAGAIAAGGKLFLCGNGGSAAGAQHLAAELTGKLLKDRRPLPAVALGSDTSALTAIANDYAFEQVFARQLQALARTGDVLIGLSTSGNSANVVMAVKTAKALGVLSIGLLGHAGGRLKAVCDDAVVVASPSAARVQEAHLLIAHSWCELIEQTLGID